MKITEHLTTEETRCRCKRQDCRFGSNPGDLSILVASLFEKIRAAVSGITGHDTPIFITSGCRCKEHNLAVSGATDSLHLRGMALDLAVPEGISKEDFYAVACSVVGDFGGVGKYHNKDIIHIDCRGSRARWIK